MIKNKKVVVTAVVFFIVHIFSLKAFSSETKKFPYGAKDLSVEIKELESSKLKTKEVKVLGEVAAICKSEGCWMDLKKIGSKATSLKCKDFLITLSPELDVRVVMKDGGFVINKSLKGEVVIYGEMEKREISSFELKGILKKAKCSKSEIKNIKKKFYKYEILAKKIIKKDGTVFEKAL